MTRRIQRGFRFSEVTAQVVFWQDLQDEQDFGKPVVCPDRGYDPQRGNWPASQCGCEALTAGTKGFPRKTRRRASRALMPFFLAVEAGKGNAMIDAVIYYKPAACIFESVCWEVKGTVIKTKDMLKRGNLRSFDVDKGYVREILSSPDGHEYLALKKKSDIDINNDQKRYDLLLRIR